MKLHRNYLDLTWYCFVIIIAPSLYAQQPEWVNRPPSEDSNYYYAVGVGEDEIEYKAKQTANINAFEELSIQVFGVTLVSSRFTQENNTSSTMLKTIDVQSDSISLRGVETIENSVNNEHKVIKYFTLKRYPKSLAKLELARINKTFGNSKNNHSHIKLLTEPEGARITIGKKTSDYAPFAILLPPGIYEYVVEKDGYRTKKGILNVIFSKNQTVTLKLNKITGLLTVKSNVNGADVYLNGSAIGQTPIENYIVECGSHEIEVSTKKHNAFKTKITITDSKRSVVDSHLSKTEDFKRSTSSDNSNSKKIRVGTNKDELLSIFGWPARVSEVNMPQNGFWGSSGLRLLYTGWMCNNSPYNDRNYEMGGGEYSAGVCSIGLYKNKVIYIHNVQYQYTDILDK